VPRYRCDTVDCGRAVFNQDLGKLACPRSSTTRRCARYVLRRLMIDPTTISAIAAELGVSWHTVSSIAMRATAELVAAAGPDRLAGVRMIGVDEHRWAPRRVGPEGFVTLIIDLTPTHDQTGPARLLDLVPERRRDFAEAADLLAAPPELTSTLITHRFPIEDAVEAFRLAQDKSKGVFRVLVEPS
jgi:transposase